MEDKSSGKVMSAILFSSLVVLFIGEIFQLQHYPYGKLLSLIGVGTYILVSLLEMDRLKKINEKYFNDNKNVS